MPAPCSLRAAHHAAPLRPRASRLLEPPLHRVHARAQRRAAGGDAVRCDGAEPGGAAAVAGCVTGREGDCGRGCGGAGVGGARRSLALSADTFAPMADTFPPMVDLIADHLPVIVDHSGIGSTGWYHQ